MKLFEMEIGQIMHPHFKYQVPVEATALLARLLNALGAEAEGTNYSNDVFELALRGKCSCGYENARASWVRARRHSRDCYCNKLHDFQEELVTQRGIATQTKEWEEEIRKFAEKNGFKDPYFHCTCSYYEKNRQWMETHAHHKDCSAVKPNFLYKPTGLKISWQLKLGHSMSANREISLESFQEIIAHCINSIFKESSQE